MFNFISNAVGNALDITGSILTGEGVTSKQIAKLVDDGLTVAEIASLTGLTTAAVRSLLSDD